MIFEYSRRTARRDEAPRTISVSELCAAISAVEAPTTARLVLVDGLGGAGKSILAAALGGKLGAARSRWTDEWMPAEDAYVAAMRPDAAAMLVVDGQGHSGIDPRRSVVLLEARPPLNELLPAP